MRRLFGWLAGPRLPVYAAALAVLLLLPALRVGFVMDDHLHRLVLLGRAGPEVRPGEVFSILHGDPATNRSLIESGALPWWSAPDLRLAFFRPLSVQTMRLDYALWPDSAPLMHAHSLAWLAALVAAICVLYRQVLGAGWVAGLAGLLYAVDEAHAIPAAWLANRNALLATCFGVACLVAHDRARRAGWRPGIVVGPACLALSLLSGELGLGVVGYLVAHLVFLDLGPWRTRLLALVPSGVVLAAWAAAYRALGCGAVGSGLYIDPLRETASFLRALPDRALFLLLGQWSPLPASMGNMSDDIVRPTRWIALVVVGLVVFAMVPLVRQSASARFFGTGMLLSLLPGASAFPDNRLLFFTGVGAMGLLAEFLGGLMQHAAWLPGARAWRLPARAVAAFWIVVHFVLAPLLSPAAVGLLERIGLRLDAAMASIPPEPSLSGRTLIAVNAPDYLTTVTEIRVARRLAGRPTPARVRALVSGPVEVELTRLDERTLAARAEQGLYRGLVGRLFRDARRPLRVGDRVELSDLSVEMVDLTEDGRPREMVFRFEVPLEDPSLVWIAWEHGGYAPFALPEPGRTTTLAAPADLLDPLHGREPSATSD